MNAIRLITLSVALTITTGLHAATDWSKHPAPYAKYLAEDLVKTQTGLLDAIFHVTPKDSSENFAVAAHTNAEQGSKSGDDDMSVISTGKPLIEVQKDGVRIGVVLTLRDRENQTIGALGLMYVYHPGDSEDLYLKRSEKIRDSLAGRIASRDALFKPKN